MFWNYGSPFYMKKVKKTIERKVDIDALHLVALLWNRFSPRLCSSIAICQLRCSWWLCLLFHIIPGVYCIITAVLNSKWNLIILYSISQKLHVIFSSNFLSYTTRLIDHPQLEQLNRKNTWHITEQLAFAFKSTF